MKLDMEELLGDIERIMVEEEEGEGSSAAAAAALKAADGGELVAAPHQRGMGEDVVQGLGRSRPRLELSPQDVPPLTGPQQLGIADAPTAGIAAAAATLLAAGLARPPLALEQGWWPLRGCCSDSDAPPPQRRRRRQWWRYARQHRLQRWFGLDHFLLLSPQNYSRRLLVRLEWIRNCARQWVRNCGVVVLKIMT